MTDPPHDPPPDDEREHLPNQQREHNAWRYVVDELVKLGIDVNHGGNGERLHTAIVLWGEELAQLRMHDPNPDNGERMLRERRAQWEAGR